MAPSSAGAAHPQIKPPCPADLTNITGVIIATRLRNTNPPGNAPRHLQSRQISSMPPIPRRVSVTVISPSLTRNRPSSKLNRHSPGRPTPQDTLCSKTPRFNPIRWTAAPSGVDKSRHHLGDERSVILSVDASVGRLHRQMLAHFGIVQVLDRPFGHDRAAIHDVKAVAELHAEIEILLDEQDADFSFLL